MAAELAAVTVAAGGDHTCALDGAGAVFCWGRNDAGQLGDTTTQPRTAPGLPVDLEGKPAKSIGAGDLFTCALIDSGAIRCWGDNEFGQLGDGTLEARQEPGAAVDLPEPAAQVFVGNEHACALVGKAEAWCWGRNSSGQLGDGSHTSRATPVRVELPGDVLGMALGEQHTCALVDESDDAAAVYCWGSDVDGRLASARPLQFPTAVAGPAVCP
jgi:alpha-tubulin suppressor-like RCC1 family protein